MRRRNIVSDVVQGIIIGGVLAFITCLCHEGHGWTTMFGCGEPGNGTLLPAACANEFPGPINVPQEAMYWTTKVASTGQKLSGQHDYIMRFPARQLPPNDAFWSLTGRVLVYRDSDLSTAYDLAKQIQLTPLRQR